MISSRHQCSGAIFVLAALVLCCLVLGFPVQAHAVGESAPISWTRLSGDISYNNGNAHILESSFAIGDDSQVDTVIVASNADLAAAGASCGLAGARNAPIIVTDARELSAEAAFELSRFKPQNVLMVGFNDSTARSQVKKAVESTLSDVKPLVNANLYASTSAETAFKLYNAYGPGNALTDYFEDSTVAIIANATAVSDIVTIGAYAYAAKAPIFLVDDGKTLAANALEALKSGRFSTIVIAGSPSVVADSVSEQIAAAGYSGELQRWSAASDGADDVYARSAAIAKAAVGSGGVSLEGVALVSANDLERGIMAASACGERGAALLISDDEETAWTKTVGALVETHSGEISNAFIVGTRKCLSADFEERARRIGVASQSSNLYFATASVEAPTFEYTGNVIRPAIAIVDADGKQVPTSYCLMTYYDNETDEECQPAEPGSYTVTANGIAGGYSNCRSVAFSIVKTEQVPDAKPAQEEKSPFTFKNTSAKTVELKRVSASASGALVIPASYNGRAVTSIAAGAFKGCSKVTSLVFSSKKLASIGAKAFYQCKKLKSITFKSAKVKTVGAKAFKGIDKKCCAKVPSSRVKAYKKLFIAKGFPKKGSVKKG